MTFFFILPSSSVVAFTHIVAYFKIKFIEYLIQNCLIPPNKEASELFKGIMEIKKIYIFIYIEVWISARWIKLREIKLNELQSEDNKFNKHNNIAYI